MTKDEFIKKWIGTPWEDRATGPSSIDCWGLVYRYYLDVLDIELSKPDDHVNIITGFDSEVLNGDWFEISNPCEGLMFTAFVGDTPRHCGIMINSREVIHAYGGSDINGSVVISRLSAIERTFGKVRFFKKA